jgi:hypothetical protein
MREILAFIMFVLVMIALDSPEAVGKWLRQVDEVRYSETMHE